jgi:hypothetical protein
MQSLHSGTGSAHIGHSGGALAAVGKGFFLQLVLLGDPGGRFRIFVFDRVFFYGESNLTLRRVAVAILRRWWVETSARERKDKAVGLTYRGWLCLT